MVAEFDTADELLHAAEAARKNGYKRMDAFSPYPVHGLSEALGFRDQRVPWVVFLGGITGAIAGYSLQYYTAVIDYPLNVGGRPLNAIPQFFPVTFEATILFSAIGAVVGMMGMNLLPQPYHPVFNTPNFDRASQDKFFLAIEVGDSKFDTDSTKEFLSGLNAANVEMVEG